MPRSGEGDEMKRESQRPEDEGLAMMRVENPGWFGDEKAGDE